jgi:hypothetical protein
MLIHIPAGMRINADRTGGPAPAVSRWWSTVQQSCLLVRYPAHGRPELARHAGSFCENLLASDQSRFITSRMIKNRWWPKKGSTFAVWSFGESAPMVSSVESRR